MKNFLISLLLVLPSGVNGEEYSCLDLIGTWITSNYEYSIAIQKQSETTYYKDGTFKSVFTFTGNNVTKSQVESGTWSCTGDFVTKNTHIVKGVTVDYTEVYENIVLNSSYRKYATSLMNCDVVKGDCKGKVYEATKK
ncbi:hypothetical protein ACCI51_18990 [Microbulbifer echini]|uniref:Lipocalin-like domain-containing protein n=1 Tax=Microbulbifer echini TaxID=1529067 RepID=A0ABV4NUM8_9GAMM